MKLDWSKDKMHSFDIKDDILLTLDILFWFRVKESCSR